MNMDKKDPKAMNKIINKVIKRKNKDQPYNIYDLGTKDHYLDFVNTNNFMPYDKIPKLIE